MGAHWLHDIAGALNGLWVNYYGGWETRSRSSGGFDKLLGVCVHHTASQTDPESDMRYMWESSGDRPIGNIYLERSGIVTVGCAGASNTQGKGGPLTCSKGTVPLDSGNKFLIAIEAANNGVGEAWPEAQQNAYIQLVRGLCNYYGFDVNRDVHGHYDYCAPSCPGRKIDPAGPSRFGTVNSSGTWDINVFRSAVRGGTIPPPTPTTPTPPQPIPPNVGWVCPPFPGTGDYGCSYDTCRAWQDAMILNGIIKDNSANHDGVWGDGMHNACFNMQQSWNWDDADGVGGQHTWPHLRSRDVAPCPTCGG